MQFPNRRRRRQHLSECKFWFFEIFEVFVVRFYCQCLNCRRIPEFLPIQG